MNQIGTEVFGGTPADPLLDPLNSDGLSADQESMFVPRQAVTEAFSTASRAIEDIDRVPPASLNAPCGQTVFHQSTLYSSGTSTLVGRFDGSEVNLGGKWIIDENYRRRLEENNIPRDPSQWNSIQAISFDISYLFCSFYFLTGIR